jgi:hypothetical protein
MILWTLNLFRESTIGLCKPTESVFYMDLTHVTHDVHSHTLTEDHFFLAPLGA